MRSVDDICDLTAEAGVIASAILDPEMTFFSEQLSAHHFSSQQNGYIYYAISEIAKRGIGNADAYNITNILNSSASTRKIAESILTPSSISEFIDNAPLIAKTTREEYKLAVDCVMNAAFRRTAYKKLAECQSMCFSADEQEIEKRIYTALDDVMTEFSVNADVPAYKDVVRSLWEEIKARQTNKYSGLEFKFPTLNRYVTIERGELVVFGGLAKAGKSMMLLNCAVDLLKKNQSVLYIDSELNSKLFTARILSHLTGIEFSRLKSGKYDEEYERIIEAQIKWLESKNFTHVYMPIFDVKSLYTTVKRVQHKTGVDVLIVDYFKSSSDGDAYANYNELGRIVDTVKNEICGQMNIAGIGAAQARAGGGLADSAKISRNASTIVMIQDKTEEEIEQDGPQCGNRKLFVSLNRNGPQMMQGEYIDLQFTGNIINYEEAQQHEEQEPY